MPSAELAEWRARSFPIALVKDLFCLQCLHLFGGWWADMDYFMLNTKAPAPTRCDWLLGSEYERRSGGYAKADRGVMKLGKERIAINLGIMYAKRGCSLVKEAEHKARALWEGRKKTWSSQDPRRDKGYLDHQMLIQDTYARTGNAEILHPLLTSPFPRWNIQWESQRAGRLLYAVQLPSEALILEKSFAVNVWDDCWDPDRSDSLAQWVTEHCKVPAASGSSSMEGDSGASSSSVSGSSSGFPSDKLQATARVVATALPQLAESGVPVAVALRTMAAATEAIGRHQDRGGFAQSWSRDQLALGFLLGALKCEWRDADQGASFGDAGVTELTSAQDALRDRFIARTETFPLRDYELLFCDVGY